MTGQPDKIYLGGSPALVFARSINGGTSFTISGANLHVDTTRIRGRSVRSEQGLFRQRRRRMRTDNVDATPIVWTTLKQQHFQRHAIPGHLLHPVDRNYLLGGTQDNGTQFLASNGITWIRSDVGDGGFSVIDQNSPSPSSVIAYHTYFNRSNSQIGFARATTTDASGDPIWNSFRGCQGTNSNNGIICSDAVLFYAPMVHGPGNRRRFISAPRGFTIGRHRHDDD